MRLGSILGLGLFSPDFVLGRSDLTEQHTSPKDLVNLTNPFLIIRNELQNTNKFLQTICKKKYKADHIIIID